LSGSYATLVEPRIGSGGSQMSCCWRMTEFPESVPL
jgi:hypothetical protein